MIRLNCGHGKGKLTFSKEQVINMMEDLDEEIEDEMIIYWFLDKMLSLLKKVGIE